MRTIAIGIVLALAAVGAAAAGSEAKLAYQTARNAAAVDYKAARAQCDAIAGNPRDVCVAEAKAVKVHADAEATAQWKNTLAAYTRARVVIADANYDVDRIRCAALTGNARDVCGEQARATRVAARADARADRKVIEARSAARQDKRIAEFKVATEKCDALAGSAKDTCVSAAKTRFGLTQD